MNLLDVGHISLLSLGVLSTDGWFPQVIEFGFQPTWHFVGSSQVLRNIVEVWMFLLDGATLTVVLLREAQKLAVPEGLVVSFRSMTPTWPGVSEFVHLE